MDEWQWCIQLDDLPETWQWDYVYRRENEFKREWLEQPVNLSRIQRFGVYFHNRDHHVVLLPQRGIFFIDGKKHQWPEFDPDKRTYLIYGHINRVHFNPGTKKVTRDKPIPVVGYRQEGHFVKFKCLGVATNTGTYGIFEFKP